MEQGTARTQQSAMQQESPEEYLTCQLCLDSTRRRPGVATESRCIVRCCHGLEDAIVSRSERCELDSGRHAWMCRHCRYKWIFRSSLEVMRSPTCPYCRGELKLRCHEKMLRCVKLTTLYQWFLWGFLIPFFIFDQILWPVLVNGGNLGDDGFAGTDLSTWALLFFISFCLWKFSSACSVSSLYFCLLPLFCWYCVFEDWRQL